jgi:two-component system LytT family response regulator
MDRLSMTTTPLRVLIADDERPARLYLAGLLAACSGVVLVGEAASGREAVALIEQTDPHLALLDLQMPETGGLALARWLPPDRLPLVAFVTAFDDQAIEAFELNAIDYILKPATQDRVQATLDRAVARLASPERPERRAAALTEAAAVYAQADRRPYVDRIPIRRRDDVLLLPTRQIAFVTAEAELLHITTVANERHTITHRLHLLETRLDPRRFIRLGRGTIANVDQIARMSAMPGGTYTAVMTSGHELQVSRIQSRVLRETFLKL